MSKGLIEKDRNPAAKISVYRLTIASSPDNRAKGNDSFRMRSSEIKRKNPPATNFLFEHSQLNY